MGRVERFQKQLLNELRYCINCQPWDDGEAVWIFGARIWIRELLQSLGIPESMYEAVIEGIDCPNCGSSLDSSCEVGIRHDYEIEHEERVQRGKRLYGERLFEFSRHIRDYPYLGSAHPVGRKILRDMPRFPRVSVTESSWFRARRAKSARRYSSRDLQPPDPNKISIPDGRFNHGSKAHWYLASDLHAAIAEVTERDDAFAWVQEWRIELLENVLDLRAWDADGIRGSSTATKTKAPPMHHFLR